MGRDRIALIEILRTSQVQEKHGSKLINLIIIYGIYILHQMSLVGR